MKLEQVLPGLETDAIGRKSWYNTFGYMPRLRRSAGGFSRRVKNSEGKIILEEYSFTDEDRLANDWFVVQGNENPNF